MFYSVVQEKYNQCFKDLSLKQLSEITGYDQPRWSRYLSGKTDPSLNILLECAKRLDIPIHYFVVAFLARRATYADNRKKILQS
jgi:transcriptional regulator with XRE-family HTH domain